MIPGPTLIIACPECDFLMEKDTVTSGNTLGARYWSNGKVTAPMLPDYPAITSCGGCHAFFWIQNAKVKKTIPFGLDGTIDELILNFDVKSFLKKRKKGDQLLEREKEKDSKPKEKKKEKDLGVKGLTLKELNRAINEGLGNTKERELYLRKHLWWAVNDKENENKDASIKKIKQSNFIGMEALLSQANPEDCIMKAEIKRQSGDFQEALKYLTDLPEEYHWVSEQIKQEINMKNIKVFELKPEE